METRGERGGSRAQLIIITALVLATVFVALALVLNSGIYSENLSTRETTGSDEVGVAFDESISELRETMRVVNDQGYGEHTDVNDEFDDTFDHWSGSLANDRASRGEAYDVRVLDRTNGHLLAQDDPDRSYIDADETTGDWTLVENADRIAGFRLDVERSALLDVTVLDNEPLHENAFYVSIDDGTTEWRIYAVEDSGKVVIFGGTSSELTGVDSLDDLDSVEAEECRVEAETVTVDLSDGTVNDEDCEALAFQSELTGAVETSYNNADDYVDENNDEWSRSGGTYRIALPETADVEETNFNDPVASPYAAAAVYDVTVEVEYERSDIRHQREQIVSAEPITYEADG